MLQSFAVMCYLAVNNDQLMMMLITNFVASCGRDIQSRVHFVVRDRDEIDTFGFVLLETGPRPRPYHILSRQRRDRDVPKTRIETVSRPRLRAGLGDSIAFLSARFSGRRNSHPGLSHYGGTEQHQFAGHRRSLTLPRFIKVLLRFGSTAPQRPNLGQICIF